MARRLTMLAGAVAAVTLAAVCSAALAQRAGGGGDVLGHGEAFLSIGTRDTRESAMTFAREYAADFPSVSVARIAGGGWAVFAGIVERGQSGATMRVLKDAGRIPNGSQLVAGDKVIEIAWTPSGKFDHDTLELSGRAPRSSILSALGIAGKWAVNPRGCGALRNEDLLESELDIAPRAMTWGSFGKCEFGSIVRVGGGVFLDVKCSGDNFVLSLKRESNRLVAVTDPTEASKLSYTLQACPRGGVAANPPQQPGPSAAPPRLQPAGIDTPSRPPSQPPQQGGEKPKSTGSGFFVSATGFVVTNEHVVNECSSVGVKGYGTARLVKADAENDLALLKLELPKPAHFLRVRTEPARLGQDVVVFGFPLSSFLDNGLNVTTGIVSSEIGMHNDARMLQFTAAIQPGNSGGPIVDRTGNLVAVVRSKFSDKFALERGSFVPQSLNYGIKTDVLLRFLSSNGVRADIANEQRDKTVAELAATAREHTLLVTCH